LGVVEGLEDPREGVDAEVEEGAAGEVEVHHAVGVGEGGGQGGADAEVGGGAVDGAQFARGDDVADVDGEGEVAGPDLYRVGPSASFSRSLASPSIDLQLP
jgi:hypothetical protein